MLELQSLDETTKEQIWELAKPTSVASETTVLVLNIGQELRRKVFSGVGSQWTIWDRESGLQVVNLTNVAAVMENGVFLPEFYLVSGTVLNDSELLPFQPFEESTIVVARETDKSPSPTSTKLATKEFTFSVNDSSQTDPQYKEMANLSVVTARWEKEPLIRGLRPKIYGNSVEARVLGRAENVWAINYEWPTGAVGALLAMIAVGPMKTLHYENFYNAGNRLDSDQYQSFYDVLLLAAFDIDGDASDELLVRKGFYEGQSYQILTMREGRLTVIYESFYRSPH